MRAASSRTRSFAGMALLSAATGVAALAVGALVVVVLATISALAALVAALLTIVAAVATMGFVSNRIVNRAVRDGRARGVRTGPTLVDTTAIHPKSNPPGSNQQSNEKE